MKAVISSTRTNPKAFAVMLREAPAFPDQKGVKPIDVQPLVVVAANDDGGSWGWVNLDKNEKEVVGDALLNFGAGLDAWYWCDLAKLESHPLTCHVEGDRISVYIGFDELAFAAANHPDFWDGESGEDVPNVKITDPAVFALEVVRQMNREEEDGSTMVTKLLDKAISDAVGDGCDGVDHGA